MARGITQQDVDRAAEALLAQGERPTVDRIRQFLGTGSPNTVTRLLDTWWKSLGGRLAAVGAKVAMPAAPESVAALASQLWTEALAAARASADAALEGDRAAVTAVRVEAEAQVETARQAVAAFERRAAEAAAALATAHQRLEDRQHLVDQQARQLADVSKQRDHALERLDHAAAELQALRDRVDSLLGEAEGVREAQAAHLRAVEDRAHAEVDRARQEARDRDRALQAIEKAHALRVHGLEAELTESREAAAESLRQLAAEQARRETLEHQLASVHQRLDLALKSGSRAPRLAAPRKPAVAPRRPRSR